MTAGSVAAPAAPSVPDGAGEESLAIETRGLSKTFGAQRAVDDVDLRVPRGSVFGFLGPNGSGKTTTIRVLLGLASASSGQAWVLGQPVPRSWAQVLPRVGALVEGPGFYPFLSGRDNLRRLDAADPTASPRTRRARVDDALDRVGLTHASSKKVHAYSLGMKQRLGLANALLTPRELLVLDEPTNGLDPQGTREVRHLVRSLTADGTTVFVSSHLLSEIEQMCDHVAVMSVGRLVAQGSMAELQAQGARRLRLRTPDPTEATATLTRLGLSVDREGDLLADLDDEHRVEDVVAALVAAGVRVRGVSVEGETLEDRFVALTGEGFDVAG
ncbi:ABC transporter ATP-binding protein [Auraticoccus monumenti]|uniref:ABC-2 type transport system ATP-binding protein n=1 Tax=Auraticoccus monumenti TaxID=675864 RepID=A0A1G6V925_9ACTN|nr:ABC transporter ATP-binding protein [Auraticoccus monumenti]SDD50021.1 ABC-2 type transport system ATP-binding protein [Auraticoccus monumenti]